MRRALLVVAALSAPAFADKAKDADAAFARGKQLLGEKKFAEACAAFEDSDRIDPGIGARMNVAKCYEQWGRIATAWRWYHDAEQMALRTSDERAKKIRAIADDLDGNVPRLTIHLPAGANAAHARVKLDGEMLSATVFGVEQRIDPGPHELTYDAADGTQKRKVVPLERGGSSEVTLDVPLGAAPHTAPARVAAAPSNPGHAQRIGGIALGGAGIVAIGIASVVTLRARSDCKHAIDAHCLGDSNMCDQAGLDLTREERHRANIATVVTLAGGAAIAGGVALYLLAPKGVHVAPAVDERSASLVVGGTF